jgi:hypothetical protein
MAGVLVHDLGVVVLNRVPENKSSAVDEDEYRAIFGSLKKMKIPQKLELPCNDHW